MIPAHAASFRITCALFLIFLYFLGAPLSAEAEPDTDQAALEPSTLFLERFDDLDAWEKLTFPKIPDHSSYQVTNDGENPVLKAESQASASGIVWKGEFNVHEFSGLRWRWKIRNSYEKGDATRKEGDDYPVRLYVMFKYDPSDPAVKPSLKYTLAKLLYGKTPPYTSLNYIWANRGQEMKYLPNPYSEKAMMVILQAGEGKAGQWVREDVNIIEDYRKAFGTAPPAIAGLAIMNDSDNTGESSVSWVDDIEIYRVPMDIPREQHPGSRIQNPEDHSKPINE